MPVHNHGTEDGPGLACPERIINGERKGKCMESVIPAEAVEPTIPWDELWPYEKEQGGYWLYPKDCGVHGEGKIFIRVERPAK